MHPPPHVTALLIVTIMLFSIGLILNSIIFCTIVRNRHLHSPVNFLIATLAVLGCVLMASCLSVFVFYLTMWEDAGLDSTTCQVQGSTCIFAAGSYLGVLTLLSYNRYEIVCSRAVWTISKTVKLLVLVLCTNLDTSRHVWDRLEQCRTATQSDILLLGVG